MVYFINRRNGRTNNSIRTMKNIDFNEFSTGIEYLRSPDKEIQQLGVVLFDLHNIKFNKLYSYFTVDTNG